MPTTASSDVATTVYSAFSGIAPPLVIAARRLPLDVLAQQIVAACSAEEWQEDDLFALVRSAYPYRPCLVPILTPF